MFKFQEFAGLDFNHCKTVTETRTVRNPEPFLEKSPYDYISSGEFKKIPYIIGTNQDEGILDASPILTQQQALEVFNAYFDVLLPMLLQLNQEQDYVAILNNVTDFYLGGDHFFNISNPARIQGFIDLVTVRIFLYATDQAILLQYLQGHETIWVYNFAYRGNFTLASVLAPPPDVAIDFDGELDGRDLEMSETFLTLWTNFAIAGNPDPVGVYSWDKLDFGSNVTNENLNYLNITGSFVSDSLALVMERGYYMERRQFWPEQNIRENS